MATASTQDDTDYYDVFARTCPSRAVLEHVTGRWGSLTLGALADGPKRFNELRRRIDGISPKVLTQTLQTLERDGLLDRQEISTFPLHVEYTLTPLGHTFAERLFDLFSHLQARMPDVLAAQQRHDGRTPS
jgi:DNA-binding HxlR family transcriptional regulator